MDEIGPCRLAGTLLRSVPVEKGRSALTSVSGVMVVGHKEE